MSIDNTAKIRSFLSFDKDDFYFLQIIKRRKDNPDMELGSSVLKNYYINSFEEYDKLMPIIQRQCNFENARAYFRLNKRNYKQLGLKVVNRALVYITSNNYKPLCNVFDTMAGECPSDPIRKWVIDFDDFDPSKIGDSLYAHAIYQQLEKLQSQTKNTPMMEVIPTKNGIHIITRPFNLAEFKKLYPDVSVHKDATTLLYCP